MAYSGSHRMKGNELRHAARPGRGQLSCRLVWTANVPGRTPWKITNSHVLLAKLAPNSEAQYSINPNQNEGLICRGYRLYMYSRGSPVASASVSASWTHDIDYPALTAREEG